VKASHWCGGTKLISDVIRRLCEAVVVTVQARLCGDEVGLHGVKALSALVDYGPSPRLSMVVLYRPPGCPTR